MSRLLLPLTDLETVGIGLAGEWAEIPRWLHEALARTSAAEPAALLVASRENAQLGLLEDALQRTGLWEDADPALKSGVLKFNTVTQLLTNVLLTAMSEIDFVLGELGITPVYLKGPVTSLRYYQKRWHRWFKDIDFMVAPEHALKAYAILQKMGYEQGRYGGASRTIVPDRKPIDMSDPREYELPRLTKMVPVRFVEGMERFSGYDDDTDRVRVDKDELWFPAQVEIHYALEPDRRIPYSLRPADLPGAPNGQCLDAEGMLVYLCFKAYVDLVILGARGGTKLLADALRLVRVEREAIRWDGIVARYHPAGVCAPLRYVLHHAATLYGCPVDLSAVGTCPCTEGAPVPLDLGDLLPFVARGRRPLTCEM